MYCFSAFAINNSFCAGGSCRLKNTLISVLIIFQLTAMLVSGLMGGKGKRLLMKKWSSHVCSRMVFGVWCLAMPFELQAAQSFLWSDGGFRHL